MTSITVSHARVAEMNHPWSRPDARPIGAGSLVRQLRFLCKALGWRIARGGGKLIKRSVDVVAAASMLTVLTPFFFVVGALIKLTDGGPVFFWQQRLGKWGRAFAMPKFRSMIVNAEAARVQLLEQSHHDNSITFKMKKDPRITWIGRIIRRLSIDELPQLWNVLSGEMSLVGPRPPLPSEVAEYTVSDRRRLDVTPGLTCIWQVSGRGDVPFPEQVKMDVRYIHEHSVRLDFELLLRTVPAVLLGKGAY